MNLSLVDDNDNDFKGLFSVLVTAKPLNQDNLVLLNHDFFEGFQVFRIRITFGKLLILLIVVHMYIAI